MIRILQPEVTACQGAELLSFAQGRGDRLLDQNVETGPEGRPNHLEVGPGRYGDDRGVGVGVEIASIGDSAGTELVGQPTPPSTIDVRDTDQLDVTISGSGDVRYMGSPSVSSSISGSGEMSQR